MVGWFWAPSTFRKTTAEIDLRLKWIESTFKYLNNHLWRKQRRSTLMCRVRNIIHSVQKSLSYLPYDESDTLREWGRLLPLYSYSDKKFCIHHMFTVFQKNYQIHDTSRQISLSLDYLIRLGLPRYTGIGSLHNILRILLPLWVSPIN